MVRPPRRVVSKYLVLAYGVHESGYREVIARRGEAETEAFWCSFLRSLVERGPAGVQAVLDQNKKEDKDREETRELTTACAADDLADELHDVLSLDSAGCALY